MWIGSDSWGAKVYPVRDQEFAAESAITILPYRTSLEGKLITIPSPKILVLISLALSTRVFKALANFVKELH